MEEGMNSEILRKIMEEHPSAPFAVKIGNAIAIMQMEKSEKEQGDANISEAENIIKENSQR